MNKHKIFYAQLDLLHPMLQWLKGAFLEAGFDNSTTCKLEVAMEEALVNIIHHAYKDQPGDIDVLIASAPGEGITITLKDEGPAFNPLQENPTPIDASQPIEQIEEGGLGILFMKNFMDDLSYERQDPYNILVLRKKI